MYLHWKSKLAESDGNPIKFESNTAYIVTLNKGRLRLYSPPSGSNFKEGDDFVEPDFLEKSRPFIIGVLSYAPFETNLRSQSSASEKVQFSPAGNCEYVPQSTPRVLVVNNQAYTDLGATITLINRKSKAEITLRVPHLT